MIENKITKTYIKMYRYGFKLYRCPICGLTMTEKEYQEDCENGSIGYCYCMYHMGRRFIEFKTMINCD